MKTEGQPRFEFSHDEDLGQKSIESENKTPSLKEEETAICRECDLPLGTGNCTRCIRIRRQRGEEELEPAPKATKLVNRAGYFRNRQKSNLSKTEIEALKERNRLEVQKHREKQKEFDKTYRWLTPSERDALRKIATQEERDAFLRQKLEERKNRSA